MKKILITVFALFVLGANCFAEEIVKFNNPTCPIMKGRKVNGKHHGIYKGIRYELCCGGCQKTFRKNPEKYVKDFNNEGKIIEVNNKKCPIMGGKVNKNHFAIYNGYKVYFCCPGCDKDFKKDPEKYLKELGINANKNIIEVNNNTCPVMGGKAKDEYYTIYNGYKVTFCCPGCEQSFNSNPKEYLKKLGVDLTNNTNKKSVASEKHDHSAHKH